MESLDAVSSEIIDAIATADSLDVLEAIRIDALGKKGRISLMMRELGSMDAEDRRAAGQTLNKLKDNIYYKFYYFSRTYFIRKLQRLFNLFL